MTLTITTTRAQDIARWIDGNLGATVYELEGGHWRLGQNKPLFYRGIDITFGDDDRILFDLRWRGEFAEIEADHWWDNPAGANAMLGMTAGRISIISNTLVSLAADIIKDAQ